MKNIETILQELGIELTEEQKTSLNDEVKNNYKTVAEFNGQKKKLDSANEQISSLQNEFDTFKQSMNGADPKDVQTKLNEYETKLATQKAEYENKLNLLTLNGQLREKANEFGCIDYDVTKNLFNMDDLLKSKDLSNDIQSTFTKLKEEKPYLFKNEEKGASGRIIGKMGNDEKDEDAELRSVMGIAKK